jgi:hypothetical protein
MGRISFGPNPKERVMARATKTASSKTAPAKGKAARPKAGASAATATQPKTAGKKTFGKAAPKTVKPAAEKRAKRVIRKVTRTATGAVAMAASVIGKNGKTKST